MASWTYFSDAKLACEVPTSLSAHLLPFPQSCLIFVLQLQDEPINVKTKAEESIKIKTSSFLTGINHFLKTHKGLQKGGTSSTRTGQAVVTLPLNIVLASSTLWLRDLLSQRRCLQCLPSGQFQILLNWSFMESKTRKA